MSTAPIPNFGLASFSASSTFTYDELLSDGHHVVSRKGTVASGIGKLNRGQVVKMTVAGVITVPATAVECNAVIAENIDATSATVDCLVYVSGKMKADAIIWPGALPHADVTEALRDVGILIESVLFRDGLMVKGLPLADEEAAAKARIAANRDAGKAPEGEKPDLAQGVAESAWGHLPAEDRTADKEYLIAPLIEGEEEDKDKPKAASQPVHTQAKPASPPLPPKK